MRKLIVFLILFLITNAQAAYYHVTSAGAGDNSGDSWTNAMAESDFETHVEGSAAAGDYYFIKEGTFTLDSTYDSSGQDGSATSVISIIGVLSATTNEGAAIVYSDWGSGSNRPTFACGANDVQFGDYYRFLNLIFTTSEGTGIRVGSSCLMENCKITDTGGRGIHDGSGYSNYINCEVQSSGSAIYMSSYSRILNCNLHDCLVGIQLAGGSNMIVGCIIDTCQTGISVGTQSDNSIYGCVIYNSSAGVETGILGTTGSNNCVVSNIIDDCSKGVEWNTTPQQSNWFDYNCWNNTDDIVDTDVIWGNHRTEVDPVLGADFTVGSGSSVLDAGLQITSVSGADYKVNIGADQDDNTSGGGGSPWNAGWQE